MTSPDVTVLMPAYNSGRFIDDALESLQKQDGIDAEIIVIADTRSTDDTSEIVVKRAADDERLKPVTFAGPGLFSALNVGLDHSRGRFITFLDSDDICPPGRIARQIGKLTAEPSLGAIVGEVLLFEALGPNMQPVPGSRWARVLSPCLGAGTFRREAIDAAGHFDVSFTHSGDIDFLLRLHDSDWPIQPEHELGLLCRKHDSNMSADPADARLHLLKALQLSIARRRQPDRPYSPPPFALMKPLNEIEGSENGFPGHRTADLFKTAGRS